MALVPFARGNDKSIIWINPEHVVSVETRTKDYVSVRVAGGEDATIILQGDASKVAADINRELNGK